MSAADARPKSPVQAFEVRDRSVRQDGTTVLRIAGYLDIDGSSKLQEVLAGLLQEGVRRVVLECSDLRFITSVGVGVLIVAVGDFRGVGGDIEITALNEDLRSIFTMLDLTDYVTLT
jgi:anti-sigma B factor antagonist